MYKLLTISFPMHCFKITFLGMIMAFCDSKPSFFLAAVLSYLACIEQK